MLPMNIRLSILLLMLLAVASASGSAHGQNASILVADLAKSSKSYATEESRCQPVNSSLLISQATGKTQADAAAKPKEASAQSSLNSSEAVLDKHEAGSGEKSKAADFNFSGSSNWQITNSNSPLKPKIKTKQTWVPLPADSGTTSSTNNRSLSEPNARFRNYPIYYHSNLPIDFTLTAFSKPADNKAGLALEKKGVESAHQQDYAAALIQFKTAAELLPNRFVLQYNLGICAEHIYSWRLAKKYFARALELDPSSKLAKLELVRSYIMTGDIPSANKLLASVVWSAKDMERKQGVSGLIVLMGSEQASEPSFARIATDEELLFGLITAVEEKHLNTAVKLATELEHRQPFAADTYYGKGVLLDSVGKHEEALNLFLEANRLSPGNPDYMIRIMSDYQELGRLQERNYMQKVFTSYFPNDPRNGPEMTQQDIQALTTKQLNDHQIFNSMPIVVYIPDLDRASANWATRPPRNVDFTQLLIDGCTAWEQSSYHKVSFQFIRNLDLKYMIDLSKPYIQVVWYNDQERIPSHSAASGMTQFSMNSKGGLHCQVNLVVPCDNDPDAARRFAETATHEIGHALGLAHCPDPEDIMFFSQRLVKPRSITNGDIQRITNLYH